MPDNKLISPQLHLEDGACVRASGAWQVQSLANKQTFAALNHFLLTMHDSDSFAWDLSGVFALDHIGAQWFWSAWNGKRPQRLTLTPMQDALFLRIERTGELTLPKTLAGKWTSDTFWRPIDHFVDHFIGLTSLVGQLIIDLFTLARNPQRGPWKEISANIFHTGYKALGITALVGFLIGVVLSYLSSQQLRLFGGDIFIVNILGMSVIRELGPLLAAILVAGRSGSAMTAQLGVMRVTEELDAMLVMGLPHGFRLVMPKVIALAIAMPLLVIWTDIMALAGGALSAQLELGLSPFYFLFKLPQAVPLANFWIGLCKGFVFGMLIALVACHFGLRIKPNTESLGQGTTLSVVTAITLVLTADAIFAIIFSGVGYR